ncbi:MAG: hypothetical protein KGV56_01420 [Gammaproteobacteria bacterium]|nr:hypothetical protein [Gammaproteobacteria bacterium]
MIEKFKRIAEKERKSLQKYKETPEYKRKAESKTKLINLILLAVDENNIKDIIGLEKAFVSDILETKVNSESMRFAYSYAAADMAVIETYVDLMQECIDNQNNQEDKCDDDMDWIANNYRWVDESLANAEDRSNDVPLDPARQAFKTHVYQLEKELEVPRYDEFDVKLLETRLLAFKKVEAWYINAQKAMMLEKENCY